MSDDLRTEELRREITQHGAVTFYSRRDLANWHREVAVLEQEGFAVAEMYEIDSQSSYLIVRKK